jgi:MFS family permease
MPKSKYLKPTILMISFLSLLSGAAISPALAKIQQAFPDADPLLIQMTLTLTPLFIIPFSLLTGRISIILRKRHILFVGLTIYLLAGVGGGLMNNITMLLVMRALLGVGTGLISALSLSLIADFYQGEERSTTMGQSSAIATLGGIILILLSGWLALFSWRYTFAVYLVSIVVLIMVFFFLPEPSKTEENSNAKPGKLPLSVYGMGFLTILLMVVFYLIPTRIAIFIQENGIGDSGHSGISIATLNTAAFLVGLMFGKIRNRLKSISTLLAMLCLGSGLVALNFVQTLPSILISLFIAGMGIGTLMPTIFLVTANLVPNELNGPALSIVNSSLYLGQFVSPLVISFLGSLVGLQQIRDDFFMGGILTLIAAFLFVIWMFIQKNAKSSKLKSE